MKRAHETFAARIGLIIGIPLALKFGAYGIKRASNSSGWTCGETLKAADLNTLVARISSLENGLCPPGFTASSETDTQFTPNRTYVVCKRSMGGGTDNDVMVKVGDSWIDRYEMSQCPDPTNATTIGTGPANDTTAKGCSGSGVAPLVSITWFQAARMCANAGKHLCTNAEWQAAVSGTPDPPTQNDGAARTCLTWAAGQRNTGGGTYCRSAFGAEDMIGNVWEMTAEWYQRGGPSTDSTGDGVLRTPWPSGYGSDATWNLNGRAVVSNSTFVNGIPAIAIRGGSAGDGTNAGAFVFHMDFAPSATHPGIGARCCKGR